jgi:SM-20-related protein
MWLNNELAIDSALSGYRHSERRYQALRPIMLLLMGCFMKPGSTQCWQSCSYPITGKYKNMPMARYTTTTPRGKSPVKTNMLCRVMRGNEKRLALKPSRPISLWHVLSILRGDYFLTLLSRLLRVPLTDNNIAEPGIHTHYFRFGAAGFMGQHAERQGHPITDRIVVGPQRVAQSLVRIPYLPRGQRQQLLVGPVVRGI